MKFTNFFKLKKPDGHEYYNVSVQNDNADIIDKELHAFDNILNNHVNSSENPHGVTKEQIGLGRVDNTSDANKPISNAVLAALAKKQDKVAFDVVPTRNSTNFLTSGALFNAFKEKLDNIQIDLTPTSESNHLVYSGGVYKFVKNLFKPFTSPTENTDGTAGLVPVATVADRGKVLTPAGWTDLDISQLNIEAFQEKDPTVPSWAKAQNKPTYSASEVGAYSKEEADEQFASKTSLNEAIQNAPKRSGGTYFGTCQTASNERVKVVTLEDGDSFDLHPGVQISIRYANQNTYNCTTTNPILLNVQNTGGKEIRFKNKLQVGTAATTVYGYPDYLFTYIFDGTYWQYVTLDNDATIGVPAELGFCRATVPTAANLVAKKASGITSYNLKNGFLIITFEQGLDLQENSVPSLNISGRGAKRIFNIPNILPAGATVLLYYNGEYYEYIATLSDIEKNSAMLSALIDNNSAIMYDNSSAYVKETFSDLAYTENKEIDMLYLTLTDNNGKPSLTHMIERNGRPMGMQTNLIDELNAMRKRIIALESKVGGAET